MSSKVDGVVLVLSSGDISPEEANRTKAQLEQGGANILGVILNKVPTQRGYGYSHYYYYYYYDEDHVKHKGHRHHKNLVDTH